MSIVGTHLGTVDASLRGVLAILEVPLTPLAAPDTFTGAPPAVLNPLDPAEVGFDTPATSLAAPPASKTDALASFRTITASADP